ncbi:MAG: oxidoreductase-like domain-containing protein [Betaproteobacteria bacterium]|jgi:Oxidoreductase-like protein, N-terminal
MHMQSKNQLIFQCIQSAAQAREVIQVLMDLAIEYGVKTTTPPAEPLGCCSRGCQGCVWEGFVAAAEYWRERTLRALPL